MSERSPPSSLWSRWLPEGLAALMMLIALVVARQAISGLTTPAEIDMYRDMGVAQAVLDGDWFGDHVYRGELRWYPPLTPALAALVSEILGVSLRDYYTHAGLYLNAIGALGFFAVARMFIGSWPAVGAFGIYLFLRNPHEPGWIALSYSPWPWPFNVAQALAFGTIALWLLAERRRSWRLDLLVGAALALTFMAHPAPAVIMAVACILSVVYARFREGRAETKAQTLRVLRIGVTAFILVLPTIVPLAIEYGLETKNESPAYNYGVSPKEAARELLRPAGVLFVLGMIALTRFGDRFAVPAAQRRTGIAFAASTLLLTGYALGAQKLYRMGIRLPQLFPSYHFHLYFTAVTAVIGGVGLWFVSGVLAERIRPFKAPVGRVVVCVGLLVTLIAMALPGYVQRRDLVQFLEEGRAVAARRDLAIVYDFALHRAAPNDVFVADIETSLFAVGAAGRKAIAVDENHSSPYVNWCQRMQANDALIEAARTGDWNEFSRLAKQYGVRYYVERREEAGAPVAAASGPFEVVVDTPEVVILQYAG